MQKGIYGARIPIQPMQPLRVPNAKVLRPTSAVSSSTSSQSNTTGTRVTVSAVRRKPSIPHQPATQPSLRPPPSDALTASKPLSSFPTIKTFSGPSSSPVSPPQSRMNHSAEPPVDTRTVSMTPPVVRKDPKATIFMPKHRAHSQLPTRTTGMPSRA